MLPPCFYCENPAEYVGDVEKVNDTWKITEVCKDHFKGTEVCA